MKNKNIIIGIVGAFYILLCFYGINWLAHYLLPKWVDILIGFPLSMCLIYKGAIYFSNIE